MVLFNLMPWREQQKVYKNRIFSVIWGGCCGAVIILVVASILITSTMADNKQQEINYMRVETNKLKSKLREVDEIKNKIKELSSKQEVIFELYKLKLTVVKILEGVARSIPEGVFLEEIDREGTAINLIGRSSSNSRISQFMLNLQKYPWVVDTALDEIVTVKEMAELPGKKFRFKLKILMKESIVDEHMREQE